jgi:hypothetical protein
VSSTRSSAPTDHRLRQAKKEKNRPKTRMQSLDTRFPYMLVLPQGETEEILEKVKSTFRNLALYVNRSTAKKEVVLWQESMV